MGIGITGYLQATEEQRSWLRDTYEYLRAYDKEYSALCGFPQSIKLTTVKPSGTLSLLAGVTPGAHPGYSQYYIRRIRMASDSELVQTAKNHGYHIEFVRNFDGSEDRSTVVVSFPCSFPDGTAFAAEMTAVDQLNVIKRLQAEWSDNAVSVTIYYQKEELEQIKAWLRLNYFNVKSVSFLLHNDHGFDQAPLEEISYETYKAMASIVTPITSLSGLKMSDIDIVKGEHVRFVKTSR
jgi:ribonucleoside-triphosphate reductase (thioredoxin)